MSNKVTVLVSSCDKYEDAWEPFFKLFDKFWPSCPLDFVLSTESKSYDCDFLSVRTINSDACSLWGRRLKNAVNQINSEYILLFLEDFFITSPVDIDLFNDAVEILDTMPNVGSIKYYGSPKYCNSIKSKVLKEHINYSFIETKGKELGFVTVSLWRKQCLQNMIFDSDNPWEFEKECQYRCVSIPYRFVLQNGNSDAVFEYYIGPQNNLGLTLGKWLPGNKDLFEKNGIYNVNFERLGVLQKFETKSEYLDFVKSLQPQAENNQQGKIDLKERLYNFKKKIFKLKKLDTFFENKRKYHYYKIYYKNLQK